MSSLMLLTCTFRPLNDGSGTVCPATVIEFCHRNGTSTVTIDRPMMKPTGCRKAKSAFSGLTLTVNHERTGDVPQALSELPFDAELGNFDDALWRRLPSAR